MLNTCKCEALISLSCHIWCEFSNIQVALCSHFFSSNKSRSHCIKQPINVHVKENKALLDVKFPEEIHWGGSRDITLRSICLFDCRGLKTVNCDYH